MTAYLLGTDFWLSATPLFVTGLLAALVVLVWDWRVCLPATLFVQLTIGEIGVQRGLIPDQWGRVFGWVVVGCLLILFLSIQQSTQKPPNGRVGTFVFRALLLCLGGFLLSSMDVSNWLPLLDAQMIRGILWLAMCAIFGISTGEGALQNGLSLLLWLIAAEITLLAVTPAAVVVVILGVTFLLITLACAYLLLAEDLALAENRLPLTDVVFPDSSPSQPVLAEKSASWQQRLTKMIPRSLQGADPQ